MEKGGITMQAIREIVSRDIFTGYEIPEEFGSKFEMILIPIEYDDSREKNSDEREKVYENEQFLAAAYNSVTENNEKEDEIWGKYL